MKKESFMQGFINAAKNVGGKIMSHPHAQKLMANPTVQKVVKHPATPLAAAGAGGAAAGYAMGRGSKKEASEEVIGMTTEIGKDIGL